MKIVTWRDTNTVLWEGEAGSIGEAVIAALKAGADLTGADFRGADFRGADLRGADLRDADLTGAALRGAVLTGADFRGADLRGAVLKGAVLTGANLRDADLTGADLRDADLTDAVLWGAVLTGANLRDAVLRGADLTGADLTDADLRGADLRGADLTPIRDDLWAVLSAAPAEVSGLLAAIHEGRIDGSAYTGTCACLVGTIANIRGCEYTALSGLSANSGRPAERFFLALRPGDTPATSQTASLAADWIAEWLTRMCECFGPKPETISA